MGPRCRKRILLAFSLPFFLFVFFVWLKVEKTDLYSFVWPHNSPGRLEHVSDDTSKRQNQPENQARDSSNQAPQSSLTSSSSTPSSSSPSSSTSSSSRQDATTSPHTAQSKKLLFPERTVLPGSSRVSDLNVDPKLRDRFPIIFIIGFGKSGTRAMYDALRMHPQIQGPYKEIRYFDNHYEAGLKWYLNKMPSPVEGKLMVEKSPSYLIHEASIPRMLQTMKFLEINPSTRKFVVMFRDPITRALSEYVEWQISRQIFKRPSLRPFHELVYTKSKEINLSEVPFLNASLYAVHISKWLNYFSPSQMCYVDGERFVTDPYTVIKTLESCLHLNPFFVKDHFVYVSSRGFYCFRSDPSKQPNCERQSKGRVHPSVPRNVLDDLKKAFHPFNMILPNITGETYPWIGQL